MYAYESQPLSYYEFNEEDSPLVKVQGLESALERAIEDITVLQSSLAYVISRNEEL